MSPADLHGSLQDLASLPGLLELLVKATLVCVLALFISSDLERSAAAVKHRIVLGGFICLALMPLLSWLLPSWQLAILPPSYGESNQQLAWWTWVTAAYLGIATLLALRLLYAVLRIARITHRAARAPAGWALLLPEQVHSKNIRIKTSQHIEGPLTWGSLRPVILLPHAAQHWRKDDLQMVLEHEAAHILRGDWLGHLLAKWVHCLFWPVPGIKALLGKLSLVAEQACDDRVLAAGESAPNYASLLLRQARGQTIPAAVALGSQSELAVRVRYLVAEIVDRSKLEPQRHWTLLLCLVLVAPLASIHLVVPEPEYRLIPLYRSQDSQPIPKTSTGAVTVVRPPPPGTVAAPPPPLELNTPSMVQAGEKPSIPPP